MMTQHQVNEEKKRKFEEDIIEVAVVEYYLYADEHKRERKKKMQTCSTMLCDSV